MLCSGASSVIVVSTYALPFGCCLKRPDADLRLVPGDELRLSLRESFIRTGWSSTGHVREVVDGEVRGGGWGLSPPVLRRVCRVHCVYHVRFECLVFSSQLGGGGHVCLAHKAQRHIDCRQAAGLLPL